MAFLAALVLAAVLALASVTVWRRQANVGKNSKPPISVNYHFSRKCNKTCGFCFFTELTSHKEPLSRAKQGLRLLKEAGMHKLNFAGGEPFLYPKFLGDLVDYCKTDLDLESVSIVSNGSLIRESWLAGHGRHVDILAISCDSFDEQTNIDIGRGSGDNVKKLYEIAGWCKKYGIKFKINTVVCNLNKEEDMNHHISHLEPFRWKCFQVLMVAGENDSENTLRDVRKFMISNAEYHRFCVKHQHQPSFVPESNEAMAHSYLILDEYLRFLSRDGGQPSPCILDVGVERALTHVYWDEENFSERGGVYDWTRDSTAECGTGTAIDW